MRKFASYGPPDKTIHYYAPRTALIEQVCAQLLGDNPRQDGHHITIWAPRQTGKTWILQDALVRLRQDQPTFQVVKLNLQDLADQEAEGVYAGLVDCSSAPGGDKCRVATGASKLSVSIYCSAVPTHSW